MKTKRIFALLLSLLMALTMGLTTFAAGEEPNGTIKINGVLEGNTYTVYKIFDLDGYTAADEATGTDASYSYTISETIQNADGTTASNPLYDYIDTMTIKKDNKDVNVFNLALKPGTTDEYYVTLDTVSLGGQPVDDSATVKEIAKNLLTFIKDYNKTNTSGIPFAQRIDKLGVTDGQKVEPEGAVVNVDKVTATDPTKEAPKYNITFTGLELGYYLVDTSAGTMLGLTTTDPNAVITAKNKLPSIQKEVKKHGNGEWGENNSKAIGETVTFRTTVTVEAGAKNYVVYDNMGDGLKFMRITKVYYASTRQQDAQTVYDVIANPDSQLTDISDMIVVETEGIEYKKTPMDFKIVITDDFAATVYEKENTSERNHNIYIEYEAVVTEDAVFGPTDSNPNDTWLTYGDNNVEVAHDQTKTYVFGFDVVKTNGSKKVLNGAKFELYEDKNCITKVPLVKLDKPGENGETVYRVATQDERSAASFTSAVIEAGRVRIEGVGASFVNGEARGYFLKEIEAPSGYNKLSDPKEVRIDGESALKATVTNNVYENGGVQIINNNGSLLPETGGIGTTIFYIIGGVLLVGATVLLVTKKRMSAEKESK